MPYKIAICTWMFVAAANIAAAGVLKGPVAELAPLLGTWEMHGEWKSGQKMWSRSHYSAGLDGRSVEGRVLVKDGDGVPYQRYLNIFSRDQAADEWVVHSFHRDGSVTRMNFEFKDDVLTMEWLEGDVALRDRSALLGDGRLHWTVEMAAKGSDEFRTLIESTWTKLGGEGMPHPIDSNLFSPDENTTSFVKMATIAAPVETVYRAWSNGDAFAQAYDPENEVLRANIDMSIGGRYEWLWDGETGGNGCQVLSFIPNRMISFSWNAPPEQPDSRAQHTWVVVEFAENLAGGTDLRLTHLGFGSADHWQETRAYFSAAWPHVLDQFRKNLE